MAMTTMTAFEASGMGVNPCRVSCRFKEGYELKLSRQWTAMGTISSLTVHRIIKIYIIVYRDDHYNLRTRIKPR